MKRLFIGVPVSEELKQKIKPIVKTLQETGADFNFVSLENWHFTIKFLGEVEEKKIPEIKGKLMGILKTQKIFPLPLSGVGVFPNLEQIKVIWIGLLNSELLTVTKRINKLLNYIHQEEREEIPHLTLARVKSGKNKEKLQQVLGKIKNNTFGQMKVEKIFLYESKLTPEGPIYHVVEEFSLL